jgi:hypothetical protein
MAYASTDPRSQLATAERPVGDEGIAAPEFADFTATEPTEVSDLGSRMQPAICCAPPAIFSWDARF